MLAGISLTAAYLYFGWPFMELVDDYTLHSKYAPYIIVVSHFLLGKFLFLLIQTSIRAFKYENVFISTAIFYPISDRSSTTRGDTVIILGVGAGVHCASWLSTMYGFNWWVIYFKIILISLHTMDCQSLFFYPGFEGCTIYYSSTKFCSIICICYYLQGIHQAHHLIIYHSQHCGRYG